MVFWKKRTPKQPPAIHSARSGVALDALFREACRDATHVLVVALDGTRMTHGWFADADAHTVAFNLFLERETKRFHPTTLCSVSFSLQDYAWAFLTRVHGYEPVSPEGVPRLLVDAPHQATSMHGRIAHRIPVSADTELDAAVIAGDKSWPVHVVDLSSSGALVKPDKQPDWIVNGEVRLSLQYRTNVARLTAVVRRSNELGAFGLSFGTTGPIPAELKPILHAIEREWVMRGRE